MPNTMILPLKGRIMAHGEIYSVFLTFFFVFFFFFFFFLRLSSESLQVAIFDRFERSICQNACFHARMCLLGVKMFLNHFWGYRVGKTQKFSPEIGIFHVKRIKFITRKLNHVA